MYGYLFVKNSLHSTSLLLKGIYLGVSQRSIARLFYLARFLWDRNDTAQSGYLDFKQTGDNTAGWDFMAASIPMLLTLGACGISFAGGISG